MFRFCLFIPYGHVEEEEGVWLFTTCNCQGVDRAIERIICWKVNILEHNIRSPPGRWIVQSKSLSMRGRICGVRRFASSPSSSGMLNRVYHLVVHFQKLHCKENEEVIVGFYTKPPMGGYVSHNKISESIDQSHGNDAIYCSIVFSTLAELISMNRVANWLLFILCSDGMLLCKNFKVNRLVLQFSLYINMSEVGVASIDSP